MVDIINALTSFRPPVNVERVVARLLHEVSPKYLVGLGEVVLRDDSGLARRERLRRKGALRKGSVLLGAYHRKTSKRQPYIHLFVDRICAHWPLARMRAEPATHTTWTGNSARSSGRNGPVSVLGSTGRAVGLRRAPRPRSKLLNS